MRYPYYPRVLVRRSSLLMGLLALSACGAAPPPRSADGPPPSDSRDDEASPPRPPEESAPHIADAMLELEEAERALDRNLDQQPSSPAPPSQAPKPERPKDVPGDCVSACAALTSMDRAARYVCKLAGDEDARCMDASARSMRAKQRVESTCGRCSIEPVISLR